MSLAWTLCVSGRDHAELRGHLFPGDGKEAAAVLLCRDAGLQRGRLLVVESHPVPYEACAVRRPDRITWPGEALAAALDAAEQNGLSIILLHSHPGGLLDFSFADDESDQLTMSSIYGGWTGQDPRAGHGSAVMVPDGRILARLYDRAGHVRPIELVTIAGDDLNFWWADQPSEVAMAFGSDMTRDLGRLHACVVGVSGTGSIIAEQAARMGFGALTLIDFDRVERKNLNRILNATDADAQTNALKVQMFAAAVAAYRPQARIMSLSSSIATREGVLAAAAADIIFCCVDTAEGRQITDLIAQAFLIPLIDMGVTIPTRRTADGRRAIAEVSGRIDYVQPGGSTLGDRGVYTPASLRAEYLAHVAPDAYAQERQDGYIKGAPDQAPSVIALNMRAASAAMLEFVARAFPYRHTSNRNHARSVFALADGDHEHWSEEAFPRNAVVPVATGASEPLLGMPALGEAV